MSTPSRDDLNAGKKMANSWIDGCGPTVKQAISHHERIALEQSFAYARVRAREELIEEQDRETES